MDHVHDHEHHHGHGHDHHDHAHGAGDYYLEQLLTILVCGAFGVVAVLMYQFGMLTNLLVPQFHTWVLVGGIVLLVFVAIRGAAVWAAAGKLADANAHHDHHHDHGHGGGHDHGHDHPGHHHGPAAAPGDDHSHGNIFWRVVVLAFPILLFCLGLPNQGFSNDWKAKRLGADVSVGDIRAVQEVAGDVIGFDFAELNAAGYDPNKRAAYEGRVGRVKGQLKRSKASEREYTLFKMKMACCAADMIPLKAVIRTNFVSNFNDYDWVTVEGVLQFAELPETKQFLPVIRVKDAKGIQKATPE